VVVTLFAAVAVVMNMAFVWPQAIRLARTRDLSGVSPLTWTISIAVFAVWSSYALSTRFWSLAVANLSGLLAAVVILWVGTRAGWSRRWALVSLATVAVAGALGMVAPPVLAAAMIASGVVLRAPQFVALLRSPSVSGVSALTWLLSGVTAGCWLVVSIDHGSTAVIAANIVGVVTTLLLLAALYWRRARNAADAATPTAATAPVTP